MFKCPICGSKLPSRPDLYDHIGTTHTTSVVIDALVHAVTSGEASTEGLAATEALKAIAYASTSRPMAAGPEDDGDGHWKDVAGFCISTAARALAAVKAEPLTPLAGLTISPAALLATYGLMSEVHTALKTAADCEMPEGSAISSIWDAVDRLYGALNCVLADVMEAARGKQ